MDLEVVGLGTFEGTTGSDPFYLSWTLSLSEASSEAVTVGYRFLSGTGQAEDDAYGYFSGTSVTFAPGETSRQVFYRIDADSAPEPDESIVLEVFEVTGGALAGNAPVLRETAWILDDDGSDEKLAVFASNPVLVEGDGGSRLALFDVQLSRPVTSEITVDYVTRDGSALAGQDYTATSGALVFAAGQTRAQVAVEVSGDTEIEGAEVFTLDLSSAAPEIAQISDGVAEIRNDDSSPPVAEDDFALTPANRILNSFNLLENDLDPDGDQLSLASADTGQLLGTLSFEAGGEITYDPAGMFDNLVSGRSAVEQFAYVVEDEFGLTDTGTVSITVEGTAPFTLSLVLPDSIESGVPGAAELTFNNDGPTLLAVSMQRGLVADPFDGSFASTVFVLGDGAGGNENMHLDVKASAGPRSTVQGEVRLADESMASDIVARIMASQPDFKSSQTIAREADAIAELLGNTIGDMATNLTAFDQRLAEFGFGSGSATAALAFAIEAAGDFGSINERGQVGSLGQGWSTIADIGLDVDGTSVQMRGLPDIGALRALSLDASAFYTISVSAGRAVFLSGDTVDFNGKGRPLFEEQIDGSFVNSGADGWKLSQTDDGYLLVTDNDETLRFDADGLFQRMEWDGLEISAEHDADGQIIGLSGPNNASLTFARDGGGMIQNITDADGHTVSLTYSEEGLLETVTRPAGTSSFAYDAERDLILATAPGEIQAGFTYDDLGRLDTASYGGGTETEAFTYDSAGGLTITDGEGRSSEVILLPGGATGRVWTPP